MRVPSRSLRLCLLAYVTLLWGCQHYGLAGRPPEGDDEAKEVRAVTVSTVATPAHWSFDGPRLTQGLVEGLRQRGLEARWDGSTPETMSLQCSAGTPPAGSYLGQLVAEVRVTCRLQFPEQSSERMSAHVDVAGRRPTRRSLGVIEDTEWIGESAVFEALQRLIPSIADRLRDVESRGRETSSTRRIERR